MHGETQRIYILFTTFVRLSVLNYSRPKPEFEFQSGIQFVDNLTENLNHTKYAAKQVKKTKWQSKKKPVHSSHYFGYDVDSIMDKVRRAVDIEKKNQAKPIIKKKLKKRMKKKKYDPEFFDKHGNLTFQSGNDIATIVSFISHMYLFFSETQRHKKILHIYNACILLKISASDVILSEIFGFFEEEYQLQSGFDDLSKAAKDFSTFWSTELGTETSRVFSYAFLIPLVYAVGGVPSKEKFDNFYNAILMPSMKTGSAMLALISFIAAFKEYGIPYFKTGDISYLYPSDEYAQWTIDAMSFVDWINDQQNQILMFKLDNEWYEKKQAEYTDILTRYDKVSYGLRRTGQSTKLAGVLRHRDSLIREWNLVVKKKKQSDLRPVPYTVMIHGNPGVGKTHIVDTIHAYVCSIYGSDPINSKYVRNITEEFWSGYKGQSVIVYDDLGGSNPKFNPELAQNELLHVVGDLRYSTNQADLADKGKVFAEPECVIGTSNFEDFGTRSYFLNLAAAMRRFTYYVEVSIIPECRKEGGVSLDPSKARPDYSHYSIQITTPVVQSTTSYEMKKVAGPMSYRDFCVFIFNTMMEHKTKSEVEFRRKLSLQRDGVCDHCHLPVNVCTCYEHQSYSIRKWTPPHIFFIDIFFYVWDKFYRFLYYRYLNYVIRREASKRRTMIAAVLASSVLLAVILNINSITALFKTTQFVTQVSERATDMNTQTSKVYIKPQDFPISRNVPTSLIPNIITKKTTAEEYDKVLRIIASNTVRIRFNGSSCFGMFVCGKMCAVPKHMNIAVGDTLILEYNDGKTIETSVSEVVDSERDVSLISLPIGFAHKSLVKYFDSTFDPSNLQAKIFVDGVFHDITINVKTKRSVKGVAFEGYEYTGIRGYPGLCGSPIIVRKGNGNIVLVGHHSVGGITVPEDVFFTPYPDLNCYELQSSLSIPDYPIGVELSEINWDRSFLRHDVIAKYTYQVLGNAVGFYTGKQKSQVVRSDFSHPLFPVSDEIGPPILGDFEQDGKWICPHLVKTRSISQANRAIPYGLFAFCAEHYFKRFPQNLQLTPFSLSAAMNGIPNTHFGRINLSTSAGLGLMGTKRNNVDVIDEDKYLVLPNDAVMDHIEKIIRRWNVGELGFTVANAPLKDEPIKRSKVFKGKVRVFNAMSFSLTVIMRILLGPLFNYMREHPFEFETCIGINCCSDEWKTLYTKFKKFGDDSHYLDTDYASFDSSLTFITLLGPYIMRILDNPAYNSVCEIFDNKLTYLQWIQCLFDEIHFSPVVMRGDVVVFPGYMLSGLYGTAELNSMCESIIHRMIYYCCVDPKKDFDDNVVLFNYGDDNIDNTHSNVIDEYSPERRKLVAAELGFEITDADRKSVV